MAHGSARHSAGNTYRWNYHQSIQPIGDGSHSRVVDDFVLSEGGPAAGIHSHFIAIIAARGSPPRARVRAGVAP